MKSKIGIFWIYQNTVLGKARPLSEGESSVAGLLDSPDDHVRIWELAGFRSQFPALRSMEYQQVPRGRVLYAVNKNKVIVYMDKSLHNEVSKQKLIEFFALQDTTVLWKTDPHYTVSAMDIDGLLI